MGSGTVCCVPGCKSNQFFNRDVSFHSFPKDAIALKDWVRRIDRPGPIGTFSLWTPTRYSRICGLHFNKSGRKHYDDKAPIYFPSRQAKAVPMSCKERASMKKETTLPSEMCASSLSSQFEKDEHGDYPEIAANRPFTTKVGNPGKLHMPAESCWPTWESYLTEETTSSAVLRMASAASVTTSTYATAPHNVVRGPTTDRKIGSNRNCCIVGCYNTKKKNHRLAFYKFPDEIGEVHKARRRNWIHATGRVDLNNKPWVPTDNSYMCSEHFVGGRKVDVFDSPSYLPTIFPPGYGTKEYVDVKKNRGSRPKIAAWTVSNGSCLLDASAEQDTTGCRPWTSCSGKNQVVMATHEADDEITTEQHLFYAAVKTEPDCSPSSPTPFASVRMKQEPVDDDETSTDAALAAVAPVEMVDVDSVAVKTEYDEDMIQWRGSNPDVDPLHTADINLEVKEEINDDAVDCHKEATEAFSWPVLDNPQDLDDNPATSSSPLASSLKHVDLATKIASPPCTCPVCCKQFKHKCLLRKHLAVHSELRPFPCPQCDKTFKSKPNLQYHMKRHTGDMPFACTQCDMRFYYKTNLSTHLLSHSDVTEFPCSLCAKVFKCQSYLNKHMRGHAENAPFECDRCELTFKFKRYLDYHKLEHTNKRAFACDRCPKTFKRKSHLQSHAAIHTDGKPFACDRCPAAFKTRRYFLEHVAQHSDEHPFKCDKCTATFFYKRELLRHAISHSNDVLFSCNDCSKKFTSKGLLVSHLVVHATEKPFECGTCALKCKTKGVLVRHLKCHSNERPWACGDCDAKFQRKYQLNQHSSKHGVKTKTEPDVSNEVAAKYYV